MLKLHPVELPVLDLEIAYALPVLDGPITRGQLAQPIYFALEPDPGYGALDFQFS